MKKKTKIETRCVMEFLTFLNILKSVRWSDSKHFLQAGVWSS